MFDRTLLLKTTFGSALSSSLHPDNRELVSNDDSDGNGNGNGNGNDNLKEAVTLISNPCRILFCTFLCYTTIR